MPIYPDNPYFGGIAPKQLRRGRLDEVQNYVPAVAELVYSTSTNELFVGNGTTVGGLLLSSGGGAGGLDFGYILAPSGFSLDLGSI
jgi:hypothetical protein